MMGKNNIIITAFYSGNNEACIYHEYKAEILRGTVTEEKA